MATSGTSAFNLDIIDLCEEAFERAGIEMRTAYDLRTARRALDIMMLEWQNKGVNLWCTEEANFTTVQSQAEYSIDTDTIDVLEHVVRVNDGLSNQADYWLDRISLTRYAAITDKTTEGRPTMCWFDRQIAPKLVLYPVPDAATYKIYYWKARRIEDVGADGSNNMDIPERFIPAIVTGLAYQIGVRKRMEVPGITETLPFLKEDAMEQFTLATQEDREKVSLRIRPMRYDRGTTSG